MAADHVTRRAGAVVGLVTAGAAIGASELVAGLFGPGSSPVIAVGGAAIDLSPRWLKAWAIRTFGTTDKAVLLAGIAVVLALVAVLVGIAAVRRPRVGAGALAALGGIGALAAVTRPANDLLDAIPSVAGTMVGLFAYWRVRRAGGLLAQPAAEGSPPAGPEPSPTIDGFDRRRFLRTSLATAGLAVVGGGLGRMLQRRASVDASRAAVSLPPPADPGSPTLAGADLGLPGLPPFITPNERFYRVDTTLFVPSVDAANWTLRLHGMVDHERTITYDELLARPLIERDITLTCVSNEVGGSYVGTARWTGARLADLLAEAGMQAGATQIVSRSVDGFTVGTPTAVVMDGRDAMLAVAMNGEPLPLAHGFPVRMVVPGLYGYVSATKWVVDMELTTFEAYDAYWVERGWAQQAPIKTQCRVDTPRAHASLRAGQVAVAGVAWAQHVGIAKVEVRVDDGPWTEATLAAQDTIDTWRQWVYRWQATPGAHSLAARATDRSGAVQSSAVTSPFPDGATGYPIVSVTVA